MYIHGLLVAKETMSGASQDNSLPD